MRSTFFAIVIILLVQLFFSIDRLIDPLSRRILIASERTALRLPYAIIGCAPTCTHLVIPMLNSRGTTICWYYRRGLFQMDFLDDFRADD